MILLFHQTKIPRSVISIEPKRQNTRLEEFFRFCIVGVVATMIHYGVYLALVNAIQIEKNWWTNLTYTIGYLVSWFCNLFLTARFTFQERVSMKRGFGFALCHGVNYVLHLFFLNLFIWMGMLKQWAPIPVYGIVVPINYVLVRTVFKRF